MSGSYVPRVFDPRDAGFWPDINLCMQLFDRLVEAWPDRTIVPSLAERWEISDDGLRYVFHLREGLRWSDGEPLTAHDWVFGLRRVLDPERPGASAPIYFVLENGEEYFLGHNDDAEAIGVRALDDRTVEFRLVAPAPYFMSVVNRPDSGPRPAVTRSSATATTGRIPNARSSAARSASSSAATNGSSSSETSRTPGGIRATSPASRSHAPPRTRPPRPSSAASSTSCASCTHRGRRTTSAATIAARAR